MSALSWLLVLGMIGGVLAAVVVGAVAVLLFFTWATEQMWEDR